MRGTPDSAIARGKAENQAERIMDRWKQRFDMASLDMPLKRLYSSIVAVVLGGSMWIAFFAIAMQQTNWEGVLPTIPAAFIVGLVGFSVFVVGITVSLLLVSRLVKGLQAQDGAA